MHASRMVLALCCLTVLMAAAADQIVEDKERRFQLSCPENWKVDGPKTGWFGNITMMPPEGEGIVITVMSSEIAKGITPAADAAERMKNLSLNIVGFRLIDKTESKFAGLPAYKVHFAAKGKEEEIYNERYFFYEGTMGYQIEAAGKKSLYDKFLKDAQAVMNTFKFTAATKEKK